MFYALAETKLAQKKDKWAALYPSHIVNKLEQAHHAHNQVIQNLRAKSPNGEVDIPTRQRIIHKIRQKLGVSVKDLKAYTPKLPMLRKSDVRVEKHPPHISKKFKNANLEYNTALKTHLDNGKLLDAPAKRKLYQGIKYKHGVTSDQIKSMQKRDFKLAAFVL